MITRSDVEVYNYGDVVVFISLDTRKTIAKVTDKLIRYYVNKSNFDKGLIDEIKQYYLELNLSLTGTCGEIKETIN
jgi:hypothetical protein